MSKHKETKQEVATVDPQSQAMELFGTNYSGFENDTMEDHPLPFFNILQGLSPQMETVEGAKLGYIINTGTDQLYPNGIDMVVVKKERKYVEWKPNRGGFVAAHDPNSKFVLDIIEEAADKFKLKTPAGNDLMNTMYLHGVLVSADRKPIGYASIGFSSTKMKRYMAWNGQASAIFGELKHPIFRIIWHWGSVKERNDKGEFFNWTHSLLGNKVEVAVIKPTDTELVAEVRRLLERQIRTDYAAERATDSVKDAM